MKRKLLLLGATIAFTVLPAYAEKPAPEATVYTAGKIITMADAGQTASAVAVVDGRIVAVGDQETIARSLSGYQLVQDERFADKVLMPGLIDNHLHPALAGVLMPARFITPWEWTLPNQHVMGAQGRETYLARLAGLDASMSDPSEFLITWGYHQYFHGELSREDINRISATRPIIVWHRSFHEIYANDAALERLGVSETEYAGKPGIDFPRGHFYENGLFAIFPRLAPIVLNPQRFNAGILEGLEHARLNGVTTMADPGVPLLDLDMEMAQIDAVIRDNKLPLRMLLMGSAKALGDVLGEEEAFRLIEALPSRNTDALTFLPKQVKLFADGAFYSQLMQMRDGYTDGHHGEWITPPEQLLSSARRYWRADYQLHIHVNGDKGLDAVLDTIEALQREYPRADHRTVLHHVGYSGEDQAARIARAGIWVSAQPYYLWALGDRYAEVGLGPERAPYISRLGSLERAGVPISLHSDLPMAPATPLALAGVAASRVTATGKVLAPGEKVSVSTALRGITIEAARAIQQDASIGSIEVGKWADFTVLEQDPLAVAPDKWRDIPVWGTVLGGEVYPATR